MMSIHNNKTSKPLRKQKARSNNSSRRNPEETQHSTSYPNTSAAKLNPDDVMYLQRTIGNHAVRQLLPADTHREPHARAGMIQRVINKRVRRSITPMTDSAEAANEVYLTINQYRETEAVFKTFDLIKDHITQNVIEQEIVDKNYLTDNVQRSALDAAKIIYPAVEAQHFQHSASLQNAVVDGIKVSPLAYAKIGEPRAIKSESSKVDLHAPAITFDATIGIETPNEEIAGKYLIGLTQTVIGVDRSFSFITNGAKGRFQMDSVTSLSTPTNDRNESSEPPWYNARSYAALSNGLQAKKVTLFDMPGEEFSSEEATFNVNRIKGTDDFKTWLILYNTETKTATFLQEWKWGITYTDTKIETTLDDPLGKPVVGTPPDAMLSGARARDLLKPVWKFTELFVK